MVYLTVALIWRFDKSHKYRDQPITVCLFFYLLCYAAVFLKFTYYAQNYAQE